MKNIYLTVCCCCLFVGTTFSQKNENRKWTIEFGIIKSYVNSEVNISNSEVEYQADLTNIIPLPTLRLTRNLYFKKSNFSMKPFLGLAVLGVDRGTMENSQFELNNTAYFFAVDRTNFKMVHGEIGNFINYSINNFEFQVGIKGQYLLQEMSIITEDLSPQRVRLIPTPLPDSRELSYDNKGLVDFSANAGFRVQYNWKRFTAATEYWQGLTDLSNAQSNWFTNDVYENNIRFMLGYQF